TVAVTDHDTVAGLGAAAEAAAGRGMAFVPGIECTAIADGRDVHILGYYIDPANADFGRFLAEQRERRRERVVEIARRLGEMGTPIDIEPILVVPAGAGRSLGRPAVAQALMAAGHAVDIPDAFARFLQRGRPGFVPRIGPDPRTVLARLHAAGGIASIAHPGKLAMDDVVVSMLDDGLDAIEVYHSDHTIADVVRYQTMADARGVLVTGGSDYHGPGS